MMSYKKILLILGFLIGIYDISQTAATVETYRLLNLFSESFRQIRQEYVTEISEKKLIEGAIAGMVGALDPHSSYVNQQKYQDIINEIKGEFGGIGAEITLDPQGNLKIITPLDETPAAKANLQADDIILSINNHILQGLSLNESSDLLKGVVGEPVTLVIQRNKVQLPPVTLRRDKIKIPSIKWLMKDKIVYVRIPSFSDEKIAEKFFSVLKSIQKKLKGSPKGLIIDLRNNPGGLVDQTIQIANAFLKKDQVIVSVKGRKNDANYKYTATPFNKWFETTKIILLINKGTASSPELLSGALQDHKRALIMGQTSYGKGSIQTIKPLSWGDSALRLTTGFYYTPHGHFIHEKGIVPDVVVPAHNPAYKDEMGDYQMAQAFQYMEMSLKQPDNKLIP